MLDAKIAIIGAQALFLYILAGLALAEGKDGFRQKEGCFEMRRRSGIHALGLTLRQAFCQA